MSFSVFTSTPDGFSVTSTLIYGDRDAILVDPQFLLSEAHKAAAMILESKKNLTTVYTTHAHPDHYFGLAVIKPAFSNARVVALPAVVTGIKNGWEARQKFWSATYGSNQAAGVVEVIYHAAGATAIFESEGFARRFRDVHAVTQQITAEVTAPETRRIGIGFNIWRIWISRLRRGKERAV